MTNAKCLAKKYWLKYFEADFDNALKHKEPIALALLDCAKEVVR